jgi:hypothetical protein
VIPENPTEAQVKALLEEFCTVAQCRARIRAAAERGDPMAQRVMVTLLVEDLLKCFGEACKHRLFEHRFVNEHEVQVWLPRPVEFIGVDFAV